MAATGGDKVSFEVGRDSRDVRFSFCGDRFGNDRTFEYDTLGRLVKTSRRTSGERTVEPVASIAYGNGREPVAVSLLDEKGQPAVTTRISRDAAGRPVAIDDGRGKREVSYNRAGYPTEIKDVFDNVTKVCYNTFNIPVRTIDANGIVTEYKYNDAGLVASAVLKDGAETIASVTVAYDKNRHTNTYTWDGLALIQRGDERFVNEPHVGGGNPVASSMGTSYFNDMLGTTVGAKSGKQYSAAALSAFGERLDNVDSTSPAIRSLGEGWFTGKPQVAGLGHAFLMRNYRAGLGKWQTADPMGYPDGWNALAYCGNGATDSVDLWGCVDINLHDEVQEYEIWKMAKEFSNPGIITVAGHGNIDGVGGSCGITVEALANLIRSNSAWDGIKSIELISCQTGLGSYPQQLANELGVSVYAPNTFVFWFGARKDGGKYALPYVYDQEYDVNGNGTGFPDWTKKGRWIKFDPE